MNGDQEDLEGGERATEVEEPIEECSWFFVGVSFLFTSVLSVLRICYGLTLEDKYWLLTLLGLSIVGLSFVMAMVCKPKRTDAGYKRYLYFHFFTFAVVCEVGGAVGHFRLGLTFGGWFALFRIPLWCLAFWLGLKLRESAAKLPPQELSEFLCQAVLVKGTAALGTMLLFSFETVSCFISQNSLSNGQCTNTSTAATFLSAYLVSLTVSSIFSKTVPRSVQTETAVELSSIASLKGLKWWQQIQGGLVTITAMASMYLLGVLGVEGEENSMVGIVGAIGAISIGFVILINATMLAKTDNEQERAEEVETINREGRSSRGFSDASKEAQEDAFALSLL